MTKASRFCGALEAITGITLAGLFLNALAHRRLWQPIALRSLANEARLEAGVLALNALIVDVLGVQPESGDRIDKTAKAVDGNIHRCRRRRI